jgi:hypothetical protein
MSDIRIALITPTLGRPTFEAMLTSASRSSARMTNGSSSAMGRNRMSAAGLLRSTIPASVTANTTILAQHTVMRSGIWR